ncbi:MAG: phage portal protein [Dehalococcoidaceae bacterium]|nr:phage portal protein [Dehalococcoidaceae bacterium]
MNSVNPSELGCLDRGRLKRYREMLAFYAGSQWPGRARRNEKRLTFNYARVVVDKITSYLMSGLNVRVLPGEAENGKELARQAQNHLGKVSRQNGLDILDYETEVDTAILGDGCYKVTWDDYRNRVRVSAPDVQGVFAWWRGDDTSELRRVAASYRLDADEIRKLYPGVAASKEAGVVETWTEDAFELWIDQRRIFSRANPYGFIPFIVFPNLRDAKSFWGVSDIAGLVEPQAELNRAMSQLSHILELSGNPIAVLENVERAEGIAVNPGAVWTLPEDARAYLLDLLQGGGVQLHIGYIDLLYRVLHDTAESPRAAFGGTSRNLSGIALEVELQPLLHKVWRKRLIRTAVYRRRAEMILKLLTRYTGIDYSGLEVEVDWRAVLPRDFSRTVEDEEKLVQTGVHSRRRAAESLGVESPEAEFERWLEERKAILSMNRQLNSKPGNT